MAERFGPGAPDYPDMLGSWIRHGLDQEQAPHETFAQITAEVTQPLLGHQPSSSISSTTHSCTGGYYMRLMTQSEQAESYFP